MRVMHVISALAGGGAEVFVKDLSIEMAIRGHSLALVYVSSAADQHNEPLIETQFLDDMKAAGIAAFEIGHSARRNILRGAWRLRRLVKHWKPDVLHIHLGLGLAFRSLIISRVPTIYTHHNTIFKFSKALSRWFDISLDGYVAICKSCEVLLRNRTTRPIVLIRNGISARRVASKNANRGTAPFKVLSVGRISAQKNYQSLIQIASILKSQYGLSRQHMLFQVCGDGDGLSHLNSLAISSNVDDIVQFLGGRSDVPELMAASDALLMTSNYEGMPITLIEAANAGLPIVATAVGGCVEIVNQGENGFLFEPNENAKAAEYIHRLYCSPELRLKFSEHARRTALDFDMDRVTEKHVGLYRNLIGQKVVKADI
jgi:glycosyltransferase involved in cell wall biosynthesis